MLSALRSAHRVRTRTLRLNRQPIIRHGVQTGSQSQLVGKQKGKEIDREVEEVKQQTGEVKQKGKEVEQDVVKLEDDDAEKVPEIPPLQRPLGVPDVPTTKARSLSERSADMLNQEKQLEKRRHLVKVASTGYFHDLHMTRHHGGKTWMAPSVLIREDKALYFPNIKGVRLDNGQPVHSTHMCAGKISVISMLSTKISEYHASSFTDRVNQLYQEHPSYQYIQINLQENILKSLLVHLFLSSLRSKIPHRLHPTYMVSRQNMEYVREQLGMVNSRIGYTYLVDDKLKVRWAACADAKEEEEEALVRGVGVLLKRFKGKTPPPPPASP